MKQGKLFGGKDFDPVNFIAKYSIYFITLLMIIICAFTNEKFLMLSNVLNILRSVCVYALIAYAQAILMISGNLNLAAGTIASFAGCVAINAYVSTGNLVIALLVSVVIGVICCGVSGGCVVSMGLPPFVATLAMQYVVRGINFIYTNGATITKTGDGGFKLLGQGYCGPVPMPIVIMLIGAVVLWIILDRTTLGRNFYAVGGNAEAARASGISVPKLTVIAYLVSGIFVGVAGIVYASRINAGVPDGAANYAGMGIAASVIGGVGFAGGSGGAWGALLGAFIIGLIANILNLNSVDSYVQVIVNGVIIMAAVGLDTFTRKRRVMK